MNKLTVIVGSLPPPMGGAAKNTKIIADDISKMTKTLIINTSVGALAHNRSFFYHVKRLLKTASCLIKIFLNSFSRKKAMYIVPDGGFGLIYTSMYVLVAFLFRYNVYFHHRTFLYIDKKSYIMAFCCFLLRNRVHHIFLSHGMGESFFKNYVQGLGFSYCDNSRFVSPVHVLKESIIDKNIVIGHLSNLCGEKGFYEVVKLHKLLISKGYNAKLLLAGEPVDSKVEKDLNEFLSSFRNSVVYYNHIDGKDKDDFYSDVHFFFFPTMFKQEAQPNVIYEAMAKSCVCISWGRACIPEMFSSKAGLVVDKELDIVAKALDYITGVFEENSYNDISYNAFQEVMSKKKVSLKQYSDILDLISGKKRV